MEGKTILVSVLLVVLGVAAAVAGFAAESKRVKKNDIKVEYDGGYEPICEYPSSPAMGLALAAAVALALARIIVTSTTGGCCRCCRTIPNLRNIARVCIVISWITSVVAIFLFLGGAKLSSKKGVEIEANGMYYCYTVRPGIFLGAGIMGLVGVLLGLVYYHFYVSAAKGANEKSGVEVELEAPPINDGKKPRVNDGKKPPMTDGKKPPMTDGKKPPKPLQK
ncbi:uncharacterized protein LOC112529556 [Cynara cardunculus var. scolymus]|uniref:Uncharacterized protein n=1 Tax=Cynara cardunculus var. scolymus TaxID=59895 RepID=A0A103XJM1_CYNCS|nr:uncharacterized protein LOC112529556 [Cynara cardunculus var. scolymus]KVH91903.1 Protein of unknown function DUF1218 [Cynara cardunculus var. scolymus]